MNISNMTVKQIIEENHLSKAEAEWLEKGISMMMTLRKHIRLSEIYQKNGSPLNKS